MLTKAVILGFILGIIFFVIAPLGLGSRAIESLRPILIPGVLLIQLFDQSMVSSVYVLSAIFLNGCIYSILVFMIFFIRSKFYK